MPYMNNVGKILSFLTVWQSNQSLAKGWSVVHFCQLI